MSDTGTYTVSELLQREVSLFPSVFSKEAKRYTLGSVLNNFVSRQYANTICEAREYLCEGDTEMYKVCKSMLPVVAFSGVFEDGHSKANLVRYNNIVIIDIDHLSEEELLTIARQLCWKAISYCFLRYYYDEKEESHKQEDYYSIDNRSGGGGCIPRYGCDCQPLCR